VREESMAILKEMGKRENQGGGEEDKSMSKKLFIKRLNTKRKLCLNRLKTNP
jgi:hypothetical protein